MCLSLSSLTQCRRTQQAESKHLEWAGEENLPLSLVIITLFSY